MPIFADFIELLCLTLLIAFLTETIVETIKQQFARLTAANLQLISLAIALIATWLFQASLFITDSKPLMFFGYIVIAFVASRGSNYIHNWFDTLPRKSK